MIPYSVRGHDLSTLIWAPAVYHHIYNDGCQDSQTCGYLSPVTTMNDEARLLLQLVPSSNGYWCAGQPGRSDDHTDRRHKTEECLKQETFLPIMTEDAKLRFARNLANPHLLFPIVHLQWADTRAGSSSIDCRWLKDVEVIIMAILATILVSTGFSSQQTRASKIGIFAPWLRVTNHLVSFFSLSQWKDHKNRDENPWDQLVEALGEKWMNMSVEELAKHLLREP